MPDAAASNVLAQKIANAKPGDAPIQGELKTSTRVLRHVTEGIYREPWAALRELISNSYDADATTVHVSTDPPRFKRITVRDNGNGFTTKALAAMLENIGGSPKRSDYGANLGVTDPADPTKSVGGRRLIGKLGIGLFSVSQLTQQFRIVTKVKGEKVRTVADVTLFRANEESENTQDSENETQRSGTYQITVAPAADEAAHGTDVIIDSVLPKTREQLQSRLLWTAIHDASAEPTGARIRAPSCHIGFVDPNRPGQFMIEPQVPWRSDQTPFECFSALTEAMFDRALQVGADRKPSLETTFDNYLKYVWLISLAVPIDYIDRHPFDIDGSYALRTFAIGALRDGTATEIHLQNGETLRKRLNLRAPERGGNPDFSVIIDGLELRRPIRFRDLPVTSSAVDTPLLFVGSESAETSKYSERVTGGPLSFEGYLLWSPKVVPLEHIGVLVRIGDASGALFDETFMRYQVSEQKRKEQVTAEVFALKGLEDALNIDREGFNFAHPHYQYVTAWVHDAFKQFATKHKAIGKEKRDNRLAKAHMLASGELQKVVEDVVGEWTEGDEEPIPVEFIANEGLFDDAVQDRVLRVTESVRAALTPGGSVTMKRSTEFVQNEKKLIGVVQLLHAAGVFEHLTAHERDRLLRDLAKIIFFQQ